ncbi:MAG: glycoside hydrolase family 99-like domain-containing protein [Bacteroides sp.]|nr:glycoside hydrolase family 99-like domain-containing protein [Bacteroides sp.]
MNRARVIAFYLPQFHPIPENDRWWMKGFTEWTNVGKARPLFLGHYQPKVPADLGYYDLRVPETRKAQADMAREYGIEGFCYWHYWFGNGKRLLERPFHEVLSSGEPDFPFCLAWANESWRGFYHGIKSKDTLITQLYPGEQDYIAHFQEVLPAFKDHRYLTVDEKPIFMVYHPLDHPEMKEFIELWRTLAMQNGLKGIYFIGQTYHLKEERERLAEMGFDAINVVRLFDFEKKAALAYTYAKWKHKLFRIPKVVEYKKASAFFVGDEEQEKNIIPTLIPNWDHSPRSRGKALVLNHAEPSCFARHLKKVIKRIEHKPLEHRIAFVKSWNEWAEGNYLEPDLRYGKRYLEALKEEVVIG